MRILMVVPEWPPHVVGGGGAVYRRVAIGLAERGHSVVVAHGACSSADKYGPEDLLTLVRIPLAAVPRGAAWLRSATLPTPVGMARLVRLAASGFDVAHLHGTALPIVDLAAALLRLGGVPYVFTKHGVPASPARRGPVVAAIFALYARVFASRTIALASATTVVASWLRDAELLPSARAVVVPNGIDIPPGGAPYAAAADDRAVGTTRPLRLVSVARFSREKGVDLAAQAVAVARARGVPVVLEAFGADGGDAAEVHRIASEPALHNAIRLAGRFAEEERTKFLRAHDVVIVPSRTEGFGLAALEALACGVPLISTRVGGLRDFIDTSVAWIAEPDAESLADAICGAACDPSGRRVRAEAGLERARSFGWERVIEQYEKVLREAACVTRWLTSFDDGASGGVGGYATELSRQLAAVGRPPSRIFAQRLTRDFVGNGVPRTLSRTWSRNRPLGIMRAVLSGRADLLHVQHELFLYGGAPMAVALAAFLQVRRWLGGRTIITLHGVPDPASIDAAFCARSGVRAPLPVVRGILRAIISLTARTCDQVLVHDVTFARLLRSSYDIRTPVTVVPLVVPSASSTPSSSRRPAQRNPGSPFVSLFFGFVAPYKDLGLLIRAFRNVVRCRPGSRLIVAGGMHPKLALNSRYAAQYDELREAARLIGNVDWRGFVEGDDAVQSLFDEADLLVLPYRQLLAMSGPLTIAVRNRVRVLCSDVMRPLLGADVPTASLDDDGAFAKAMEDAIDGPFPASLAEMANVARSNATAARHVMVYESLAARRSRYSNCA